MLIRWIALTAFVSSTALAEDNWPQFRGPHSSGEVEASGLPDTWSTTDNVAWKTTIPGRGWSSPVLWGDRIFLTSVVSSQSAGAPKTGLYSGGPQDIPAGEHRFIVVALDWSSGKILWEREVHRGYPNQARHLKNSYASETPLVDADRLYAYFGNLGVFAFDHDGELLWTQRLEPVRTRNGWGTSASPVSDGERLYIVNDNENASYIAAFDIQNGDEVWRVSRDERTNFSTPYIWKNDLRTEIITTGSKKIRSYTQSGKELWSISGMSTITIPTPFAKFGLLYISSGYVADSLRPVYAIKPGASGDISLAKGETSNDSIVWHLPTAGPYNPSPVILGDTYYTLFDRGFFTAHNAKTGEEIYGKKRIDPTAGAFTASPWANAGKIFCLSEEGVTYVIRAGKDFEVVGQNSLDEVVLSTPAVVRDSLLIRTASKLYRITNP